MGNWVRITAWSVVSALKSRRDLTLENLALRHQLMVLQRQSGRSRLKDRDRLLWVWLRRCWSGWHRALVRVRWSRPRWARWSPLPRLAAFIIATPAGSLPDILPSRG